MVALEELRCLRPLRPFQKEKLEKFKMPSPKKRFHDFLMLFMSLGESGFRAHKKMPTTIVVVEPTARASIFLVLISLSEMEGEGGADSGAPRAAPPRPPLAYEHLAFFEVHPLQSK